MGKDMEFKDWYIGVRLQKKAVWTGMVLSGLQIDL
jgi:hypothetical protein